MVSPLTPAKEIRRLPASFDDATPPGAQKTPRALSLDVVPNGFNVIAAVTPPASLPVKLLAPANPNRKQLLLFARGGTGTTQIALFGTASVIDLTGATTPWLPLLNDERLVLECSGAIYCALPNGPAATIWVAETLNPEPQ